MTPDLGTWTLDSNFPPICRWQHPSMTSIGSTVGWQVMTSPFVREHVQTTSFFRHFSSSSSFQILVRHAFNRCRRRRRRLPASWLQRDAQRENDRSVTLGSLGPQRSNLPSFSVFAFLSDYGWFILIGIGIAAFLWQKYVAEQFERYTSSAAQVPVSVLKKDGKSRVTMTLDPPDPNPLPFPDDASAILARHEAMLAARQRMQEQQNRLSALAKEEMAKVLVLQVSF